MLADVMNITLLCAFMYDRNFDKLLRQLKAVNAATLVSFLTHDAEFVATCIYIGRMHVVSTLLHS